MVEDSCTRSMATGGLSGIRGGVRLNLIYPGFFFAAVNSDERPLAYDKQPSIMPRKSKVAKQLQSARDIKSQNNYLRSSQASRISSG